ncbi:hypothetical protein [Pseudodesulfovibrio sp.]
MVFILRPIAAAGAVDPQGARPEIPASRKGPGGGVPPGRNRL